MNFEYLGPHHSESVKTPKESGTGQKSKNKTFLNPRMFSKLGGYLTVIRSHLQIFANFNQFLSNLGSFFSPSVWLVFQLIHIKRRFYSSTLPPTL
jgi:hypothetical protein